MLPASGGGTVLNLNILSSKMHKKIPKQKAWVDKER